MPRLRLSSKLGQPYAQSSAAIQPRTGDGIYYYYCYHYCFGSAALSAMADGSIAGAGDDCPLLASDGP
jgi:hypothetical protein